MQHISEAEKAEIEATKVVCVVIAEYSGDPGYIGPGILKITRARPHGITVGPLKIERDRELNWGRAQEAAIKIAEERNAPVEMITYLTYDGIPQRNVVVPPAWDVIKVETLRRYVVRNAITGSFWDSKHYRSEERAQKIADRANRSGSMGWACYAVDGAT